MEEGDKQGRNNFGASRGSFEDFFFGKSKVVFSFRRKNFESVCITEGKRIGGRYISRSFPSFNVSEIHA